MAVAGSDPKPAPDQPEPRRAGPDDPNVEYDAGDPNYIDPQSKFHPDNVNKGADAGKPATGTVLNSGSIRGDDGADKVTPLTPASSPDRPKPATATLADLPPKSPAAPAKPKADDK